MNIGEYRQSLATQNDGVDPYADLTDQEFAAKLHQRHYADVPFQDFATKVGLGGDFRARGPATRAATSPRLNRTERAMGAALAHAMPVDPRLAAVMTTAQEQSAEPSEPAWDKVLAEVPTQIGARIEKKLAGVQEATGEAKYADAKKRLWQSIVLPEAARRAQANKRAAQGGKYEGMFSDPMVVSAASRLGMRVDQFTRDWPRYANLSEPELEAIRQEALPEIQAGDIAKYAGKQRRQTAARVAEEGRPAMDDWSAKALVFDGLTSIPDLLVGVGAGVAGGPVAGVGAMVGTVAPEFYADARNQGADDQKAKTYAALMSVAEAIPELPVMDVVARTPAGRAAIRRVVGERLAGSAAGQVMGTAAIEGVSESITEALQTAIESGVMDQHKTIGEALEDIARAGVIGAGMGAGVGAIPAAMQTGESEEAAAPIIEPEIPEPTDEELQATAERFRPAPLEEQRALPPPKVQPDFVVSPEGQARRPGEALPALPLKPEAPTGEYEAGAAGVRELTPAEVSARAEQREQRAELGQAPVRVPIPGEPGTEPAVMTPPQKREAMAVKRRSIESAIQRKTKPAGVTYVKGEQGQHGVAVEGQVQAWYSSEAVARDEVKQVRADIAARVTEKPQETSAITPIPTVSQKPTAAPAQPAVAQPAATVLGQPVEAPAAPTEAQKSSGTYFKPEVEWQGLTLKVENLKGSERSGTGEDGKPWTSTLKHTYGYVKGSKGADQDALDVFIGDDANATEVYVVDQLKKDGTFDETKSMVAFPSQQAAEKAYRSNFPANWTGLGKISAVPVDEFKEWAKSASSKKPFAWKPVKNATAEAKGVVSPRADQGLKTYRYKGPYGYIYAGALDTEGALKEIRRSTDASVTADKLEEVETKAAKPETKQPAAETTELEPMSAESIDSLTDAQLDERLKRVQAALQSAEKRAAPKRDEEIVPFQRTGKGKSLQDELARLQEAKAKRDQTSTPEFLKWFGGSKVVDSDGKPEVVYHGTGEKFTAFKKSKSTQGIFWVTNDRASIEKGEVGAQGRGQILDLFASIKNPAGWAEYNKYGLGELKREGYDGAILREKDGTFVAFVFEPSQLKSASRNRGGFDSDKDSILMRRGTQPGKLVERDVRSEINRILRPYKIRPALSVVRSYDQLPQPVRARVEARGGKKGDVRAFYDPSSQTFYAIADEIPSLADVTETVLHELTHFGTRAILEPGVRAEILDGMARDMRMDVRRHGVQEFGDEWDESNDGMRRLAAEERLAYFAQRYLAGDSIPDRVRRWVDRWLAAIRDFLRQVLGKDRRYDELFMKRLVQEIQAGLRRGRAEQVRTIQEPAFARAGPINSAAFRRWFGNSKVVDDSGKPLVVYHGTDQTTFVPAVRQGGQESAKAELEKMAERYGISDWMSVPLVLERWARNSNDQDVTAQVAQHARELLTQAKSKEVSPSRTDLGFSVFNLPAGEKELGVHFGTEQQALTRGEPFPFYLNIKNPIRLQDLGTWGYQSVLREVRKAGVSISEREYDGVFNARDNNEALRVLLLSKGIDGVVYTNEAEGSGDSWIVLRPEQIKSAIGNRGTFDPNDPDITMQQKAPVFYSVLLRAAETAKREKGTANEWLATLRNMPGIKQEEIEWTGLEEWINALDHRATKQEVVEFIAANQIRVEEVVKGGAAATRDRDRIVVELTALGYSPDLGDPMFDNDPEFFAVVLTDRAGRQWQYDNVEKHWAVFSTPDQDDDSTRRLPQQVADLADNLLEAARRDESADSDATQYGQYTLPGGENYTELLLTLPEGSTVRGLEKRRAISDSYSTRIGELDAEADRAQYAGDVVAHTRAYRAAENMRAERDQAMDAAYQVPTSYKSSHWSEPNIVAHVRFNERMSYDSKRTLFIEEIQSDWHQVGRSKGYAGKTELKGAVKPYGDEWVFETPDGNGSIHKTREVAEEAQRKFSAIGAVPNAPFKTTWPELAFKRILRFAAENGFDRIAWTPGDVQAERYDLSKQVKSIDYQRDPSDDTFRVLVMGLDGQGAIWSKPRASLKEIEDTLGKEVAQKMANNEGEDLGVREQNYDRRLTGLDLKVGGEGMIGFYDEILPKTVNKMVKRWGTKVGTTNINPANKAAYDAYIATGGVRVTEGSDGFYVESINAFDGNPTVHAGPASTRERAEQIAADIREEDRKAGIGPTVHSVDVSPAMRSAALEGLPLFQRADNVMERAKMRTGSQPARGYAKLANRIIDGFNDKFGWRYGALGRLPNAWQYLVARYKTLGALTQVREIARDIFSTLSQANETDSQFVYAYLTTPGATPDSIENQKIRDMAVQVKESIDAQGQALVDAGLLHPESYEAYKDQYLPRLYLRHVLDERKGRPAMGTGKKLSDMGYLKQRKDIPEEVRKVILGEITDPAFLSAFGLSRTMRDLAMLNFLDTIAQNKAWVPEVMMVEYDGRRVSPFWLAEEAKHLRRQADHLAGKPDIAAKARAIADGMDTLANRAIEAMQGVDLTDFEQIPDSPRYGALRGLYVRKEIHEDLVGAYNFVQTDSLLENLFGQGGVLTKATQWWKTSKVALNVPSHFRNMMGNTIMLHLSGVPMHRIPQRLVQAVDSVLNKDRFYQTAVRYGLKEATFANRELARIRDEWILLQKSNQPSVNVVHAMAAKFANAVGDVYQFEEAVFKIAKLIDGMEGEHLSESDAMINAHKWVFDYSLVPRWVRYTRNAPFGVPFLSYTYFAIPRMAEAAVRRPWVYLPYIAAGYALTEGFMSAFGADDDELDKLKNAFPDWMKSRGGMYLMPFRDAEGRFQVVDLGYTLPWGMLADTIAQLGRGEFRQSAETLGLLSGPIPDLVAAFQTGIDPFTGRPIAAPGDTTAMKAQAYLQYAWGLAAPGFLTDKGAFGKIRDAHTGRVDPRSGEPGLTKAQAWLRLFGVSAYPIDPEMTRDTNIRYMRFEIDETRRRLRQRLRDQNLTEEERDDVEKTFRKEIDRKVQELEQYQEESEIPSHLRRQSTAEELTSQLAPLIDGKGKPAAVEAIRQAGYPELAALWEAMPNRPRAVVARAIEQELRA